MVGNSMFLLDTNGVFICFIMRFQKDSQFLIHYRSPYAFINISLEELIANVECKIISISSPSWKSFPSMNSIFKKQLSTSVKCSLSSNVWFYFIDVAFFSNQLWGRVNQSPWKFHDATLDRNYTTAILSKYQLKDLFNTD